MARSHFPTGMNGDFGTHKCLATTQFRGIIAIRKNAGGATRRDAGARSIFWEANSHGPWFTNSSPIHPGRHRSYGGKRSRESYSPETQPALRLRPRGLAKRHGTLRLHWHRGARLRVASGFASCAGH